ncbi:MAG TPA: DUF4332 domain-containing protein [Fimbriimonadaceae bacterium]|nr:DUF4332 domain-containing protein [Fimbriimonadaceae bacterium]
MARISDIEGIGEGYAAKLDEAGVGTVEALLEQGATREGRAALVEKTGISDTLILKWVNRADLDRVKGIGSEYADLLEAAGVDSVPELAQRNAANLHEKLVTINEDKSLVRRVPSDDEVASWIEHAKTLPRVVTH